MQQQVKAAWIDSLLMQPLGTTGARDLLYPADQDAVAASVPALEGTLVRSFLGVAAGTKMGFKLSLGQQAPTMYVVPPDRAADEVKVPVRLVVLADNHSGAASNYPECK